MNALTEEQRILLANVQRAVRDTIAPAAAETDRTGTFNWDVVSLFPRSHAERGNEGV